MAKDPDLELHVADVYYLAADIGREFEKIIDDHGAPSVQQLMTKVIIALEHLESATSVIDGLQAELIEIKARVKQLEYERTERVELRGKLDRELEQIEENWSNEINQLNALVAKLQDENKRLSKSLAEKENQIPAQAVLSDQDLEELSKLKELSTLQRRQLLNKDKELLETCSNLEKFQMETEELTRSTKELYNKNRNLQKQMHLLIDEKSDLQSCIQSQHREYQILQKKFNSAMKDNVDLSMTEERNSLDLAGKLVIDTDDPNRPRFTLEELRQVLMERNDLKVKVSDLEDELSVHQPKSEPLSPVKVSSPKASLDVIADEELPVQGPINREPDEKLYPNRKLLGIRRFFRLLRRFSESTPVPLIPFSASPGSAGSSRPPSGSIS